MPFSLNDLALGGMLPAILAGTICFGLRRWLPGRSLAGLPLIMALVGGFHAGYWTLSLGDLCPESHWEWLPWVLLVSAAGALISDPRRHRVLHFGVIAVVAGLSSWLIVPRWDHLEPSPATYVAAMTVLTVLVTWANGVLARRMPRSDFSVLSLATLMTAAVILALSGSLRFAQMAALGGAAMLGLLIASRFDGDGDRHRLALPLSVLMVSLMVIGRVNSFSSVPAISYLLPPLAPLAGWLVCGRHREPVTGWKRAATLAAPVIVCIVAVASGVAAEFSD